METIDELYTVTTLAENAVIEEKRDELEKYMQLIMIMKVAFGDNDYLEDALEDIGVNFSNFFQDIDFEHKFYSKVIKYMDNLDENNITKDDIVILTNISYLLSQFETLFEFRMLNFAQFISYYNRIISMNNLNKITYSYPKFESSIKENDREKVLSLIPEV